MTVVNFKKPLPLTDEHLEDLRRSGLTDETIRAAGLYSLKTSGWEVAGAAPLKNGALSGYAIPYDDNFARVRLFYNDPTLEKKHGKYSQPPGSPCRLYIPPTLNKKVLTDPSQPLIITEGEKKALKAVQERLLCVGVGGWFNVGTGALIPDFGALALKGREVILVPDNDWDHPEKNIALGVRRLAALLKARGALPHIVSLPDVYKDGSKTGLDDYLCHDENTVEDFHALPFVELGAMLDPADPYPGALQYLDLKHTTAEGLRTLYFWQGNFYKWDGAAYRVVGAADMKESIYGFLNAAVGPDGISPYAPNQRKVADSTDALKAAANLSSDYAPPCWIGTDAAARPPAREILCTSNGLLHLPTEEQHAHTPQFFTLNALPYAADPKAGPPKALHKFLASIWPDDPESINTLQEIFGYLLTPDTSQQKIFLFSGPPRSGRGTLGRLFRQLLGEHNVHSPTLESLQQNFGLQGLIGKTMALIPDAHMAATADQHKIAERLKSISGEDALSIPRKYADDFTAQLKVRFVIFTNMLPRIADTSGALASRFLVLRLTESFLGREDLALGAKLSGELPSILNWALAGYHRLRERGHFIQPKSATELVEELQDLGSPMGAFLRDVCLIKPGAETECSELYRAWCDWCRTQGREHPGTMQTFARDLRAAVAGLNIIRHRTKGGGQSRAYSGIGLVAGQVKTSKY